VVNLGEIKTLEELKQARKSLKDRGKLVVFTNGVFDLMHVGHARLLKKAKSHGDILVVGINSDLSVKQIKGPNRPIIGEADRADLVASLAVVDYVILFSESTPEAIIRELKPDIHVKGGDWGDKPLPEKKIVESYGGKVLMIPSGSDITTTNLIKKIMESE